jgi:16S rRNA processing protein RimM
LFSVGKIIRSQGKRGELKIKLFSGLSFKPSCLKVYLRRKGFEEEFEVEYLKPYKNYHLLKLKGIDSLTQSNELVGLEILGPEEIFEPLEKGHYYQFQLIGCTVLTKDRRRVGSVKGLLSIKDSSLLIIEEGKREIFIPFTQAICLEVNLEKKEILIDPPQGLLDLNEI